MKLKGSGREALNFWVILSETLVYGSIYLAIPELGWYSGLICGTLLVVQGFSIVQNKRNVLSRINRKRKHKMALIGLAGTVIVFKDVLNERGWLLALALVIGYSFVSDYASNLYQWVMRWEDIEEARTRQTAGQVTLMNLDFSKMAKMNAKWLMTGLLPVALIGGTLFALIWMSPIIQWPLKGLWFIFLKIALILAGIILGLIPDSLYDAALTETKGSAVTADPMAKFLNEANQMAQHVDFQSGYWIAGLLITGLTLVGMGIYLYRVSQKKVGHYKPLKAVATGIFEKSHTLFSEKKLSVKGLGIGHRESDLLLRKKYKHLLKKLSQNGYSIENNETPNQIQMKLMNLYPNQENLIQIITNAYCERRYADREPENIAEVLQAFSLLKEENYDRSKSSTV